MKFKVLEPDKEEQSYYIIPSEGVGRAFKIEKKDDAKELVELLNRDRTTH